MTRKPTLAEIAREKRMYAWLGGKCSVPLRTFAKFLGVQHCALQRVESGKRPSAKTLLRIMRAFQLGPEDFRL